MNKVTLLKGDCLQKLKELEDNSVDSVVTDPPYEIGFMGKGWDDSGIANNPELWKEVLRVLKPGGHLLSFSHSRTYHRQAVAVEDAGFEIRDQIMWIYGSGFPKSHNIGKAVDKIQGNEREVVGEKVRGSVEEGLKNGVTYSKANPNNNALFGYGTEIITKGNSPYEGWGTALKPAHEPIVMARKPFKGNVANNVLEWGTGGINVDGCRIGFEDTPNPATNPKYRKEQNYKMPEKGQESNGSVSFTSSKNEYDTSGRFPANIIFECTCDTTHTKPAPKSGHWPKGKTKGFGEFGGGESSYEGVGPKEEGNMVIHTNPNCPCYILDEQSGKSLSKKRTNFKKDNTIWQENTGETDTMAGGYNDVGGASRFFYCPKSSKKDRNEGMPEQVPQFTGRPRREDGSVIYKETHPEEWAEVMKTKPRKEKTSLAASEEILQPTTKGTMNTHPTVKPTDLMAYLIRLITPKGGIVLDPFMGSGSTGKAAVREGMSFIGIEREDEYMEIAKSRIEHEQKKNKHTEFFNI